MDASNSPSLTVLQRKEHNSRGFPETCSLIIPSLGDNRKMSIGKDSHEHREDEPSAFNIA